MTPEEEHIIERYVRDPGPQAARERRAAERLIEEDPGTAAYAEFLSGFYDWLGREEARPTSSAVEAFVDELFEKSPETAVPVRPYRPPGKNRPTVLAAESAPSARDSGQAPGETSSGEKPPEEQPRFSVLTVLADDQEETVVRVLEDRTEIQGRLYVLTERREHQAHVVVSFPKLGLNLATDEDGCRTFDLPSQISPDRWASAQGMVRRPVDSAEVAAGSQATISLAEGEVLRAQREAEALALSLDADREASRPVAVQRAGTSPDLTWLSPAAPRRLGAETDRSVTVRVYDRQEPGS